MRFASGIKAAATKSEASGNPAIIKRGINDYSTARSASLSFLF
jgi:hypothetical protein